MRALVTGVAGFIGSAVADALVLDGHEVRGIDCFTSYYDTRLKRSNVSAVLGEPSFELVEMDLRWGDLRPVLAGVDVVFHLAAQPGVRGSWGPGFALYNENNVLVTQRLLEAARRADLQRFIFASSSSVYGTTPAGPVTEDDDLRPHSPYGVTKLAAEHLCSLYAANWGVPTISMRYFSVYGPRQRPDMAIHRMVKSALAGNRFPLYGTGSQARDFTAVADVVGATVAAASADLRPGTVMNIASGASVTIGEVVGVISGLLNRDIPLDHRPAQKGDVERTWASIDRAQRSLAWTPRIDLRRGLDMQIAWHQSHAGARVPQGGADHRQPPH